jgi:hypothetical protein
MDSPYCSESKLCGGAVSLFFEVPPLASNALLTTLHPLLKNVLQTVDHFKFLASELNFHGWKSREITWGKMWTV